MIAHETDIFCDAQFLAELFKLLRIGAIVRKSGNHVNDAWKFPANYCHGPDHYVRPFDRAEISDRGN